MQGRPKQHGAGAILRDTCGGTHRNTFDSVRLRDQQSMHDEPMAMDVDLPQRAVDVHFTPTRKRRRSGGLPMPYLLQGRCQVCKAKTTQVSSLCRAYDLDGPEPGI